MIRIQHLPADVVELSPLARDAISGRCRVAGLSLPRRIDELPMPADHMDARERAALVTALESNLARLAPHVAVLDAVRALAQPGACAIVTGQQPGFLTSPLYSLYKALHAIRLARASSERWERPVVALFWNHADDHDVAEVHHAYLVNPNLDLQKVALAGLSSGRVPVSRIVFDAQAQRLASIESLLREMTNGDAHADRAIELFMPRAGESFSRAFTRSMTELLGPLGLVVVEPDWIREPMSAALARIVEHDPAPWLERGAQDVRAADYKIAIEPVGAALVYRHDPHSGARSALRVGGDGFRFDGELGSRTRAELQAEIVQSPLDWSPGALLRPLVQDDCLPVAAYVGGFGELAYHAQLIALRRSLEAPLTPFVPRIACTLCDPECRVALAKLGLDVETFIRTRTTPAADLTRSGATTTPSDVARGGTATPAPAPDAPKVIEDMRAVAARAARELGELRAAVGALDPSLVVQLKRTADLVRASVDKLAEKAERVHQNKSGKGKRHERRLASYLTPRGQPQERVLGPLQFVARFGEDWIQDLAREVDCFASEHLVVHLGAEMGASETNDMETS